MNDRCILGTVGEGRITVLLILAVMQEYSHTNWSLTEVIQSQLLAFVLRDVIVSENFLVDVKPFDAWDV